MKGDFDWGNLVHWAKDDLGLALDEEFSISDERARELLAQIAAGDVEKPFTELSEAYGHHVRRICGGARARQNRTGIGGE